jgi:nitrite reductase (NADH) large subunit
MSFRSRLAVVGNGMAGARLVEEILARGGGEQFDITVFGDEPYGNYNRILLSNVLAGAQDPDEIFLNPVEWYAENGVTLRAGSRVRGMERRGRRLFHGAGEESRYDTLVLATGSSAFVPPLEGVYAEDGALRTGVFVFRTLDDCHAIVEASGCSRKVAVIGGGLLGLEAARGLLELGVEEVHVVHLMSHLMEMQIDPTGGALLRDRLEEMGVHVHLERATRQVLGEERVTGIRFADGTLLDCDMVVVSAGIRPNVDLARNAGLTVRRGMVVTDDLRSPDDPNIYGVGECVEHRGQTYGLVAPLWEQARVLADRLTGRDPNAVYTGSRVATKLKVMGVELSVMGEHTPREGDEEIRYVEEARGIYKKVLVREGRLAGAILLGDTSRGARLLQLFDRGAEVPASRAELLFPASGESAAPQVGDLPDDAQICNCNGVSKGAIVGAVQRGCRSMKSLCETTRAGLGCGSCRPQVEALLELASDGAAVEDPSAHYYVPGVPMTKRELVAEIRSRGLRSVSSVFAALAGGREDPASKAGLASLLKTIWAGEYEDERDARYINDRVHANIQKDGTFSVVPGMSGGVTSARELRALADVVDRFQVPMVKITGGQRIDLLGVRREELPEIWKELGMRSGHAYSKAFRTVKTCVGSDFCRFGLGDSTALGIALEERFKGLESPGKLKLAVAGCPRNCSEALVKDVGVVAVEGGRWEVYVGGAAGAHVRKGDLLCVLETPEQVLAVVGRFLQYYRENAKYMERTYGFVPRLGIDAIRAVVVEDAEGETARLDAALEAAIEAYRDPWREAEEPVHPAQFAAVLNGEEAAS